LIAAERRRRILESVRSRRAVRVTALSRLLGCSPATLRRDLQYLDEEGLVRRTHGGAVDLAKDLDMERPPNFKATLQMAEKRAVGAAAARLVSDGDTIALSGGTTTLEVARHLRGRENLRVLTNSVAIATELLGNPGIEVTLTGGTLRSSLELCGPLAEQSLRNIYVDTAFIGVDGFTVEHGLTTYNQIEAQTDRLMIEHARRTVVVADHTKIGQVTMALIAPFRAVSMLVTDSLPPHARNSIEDSGIEVVIATRLTG